MHGRRLRASAARPRAAYRAPVGQCGSPRGRGPSRARRNRQGGDRHAAVARRHLRPRLVRPADGRQDHRQPARRPGGAPRAGGAARRARAPLHRRGLQRGHARPPGPRAPARRGRRRRARSPLRPLARPAGAPLRLPGPPDRRAPPRRGRGRLPQPGDRPLAGGRPAAPGPGHGGRVRAGQDPGAQPARQAARGARGRGQRPVGGALRLPLRRQAGRRRVRALPGRRGGGPGRPPDLRLGRP